MSERAPCVYSSGYLVKEKIEKSINKGDTVTIEIKECLVNYDLVEANNNALLF
jgi:hypothetical protein